jgi:hypothetical protein
VGARGGSPKNPEPQKKEITDSTGYKHIFGMYVYSPLDEVIQRNF